MDPCGNDGDEAAILLELGVVPPEPDFDLIIFKMDITLPPSFMPFYKPLRDQKNSKYGQSISTFRP